MQFCALLLLGQACRAVDVDKCWAHKLVASLYAVSELLVAVQQIDESQSLELLEIAIWEPQERFILASMHIYVQLLVPSSKKEHTTVVKK